MPEFKIVWQIDIFANSYKEAAEKALEIHRDPNSIATVFHVWDKDMSKKVTIDLSKDDPESDWECLEPSVRRYMESLVEKGSESVVTIVKMAADTFGREEWLADSDHNVLHLAIDVLRRDDKEDN